MSVHTPGRLAVTHNSWEVSTLHCEGGEVAQVRIDSTVDEDTQQYLESVKEDNARRLAACWNACDGLPTESLEKLGTLDRASVEMNVFRAHLLAQRDELLAALHRMENHPASRIDELPEMARAAIAKAEGGTT